MEFLTYSRIKARKNCPMAEHLRYDLQLVPKNKRESLSIGSAVHLGLETEDIDKAVDYFKNVLPADQAEADALEINRATVRAMLIGYFQKFGCWPKDARREQQFDIPIVNPETGAKSKTFRLQGKIDAIVAIDGQYWIVEYKTAGQINQGYFERLELDDQITTYMYAVRKAFGIQAAGVIYRVLKKPSIRQTKKESLEQFCQRLEADYADPAREDFYFYEAKFYRSPDVLAQFEKELWAFTKQYLFERGKGIHCKNASRCLDWGKCEYMPICLQSPDWELFYEQKEIHEELREGKTA